MKPWTPKRLKTLRRARMLSLVDAGRLVGVTQTAWWMWEHGKAKPGLRAQRQLEQVFGQGEALSG